MKLGTVDVLRHPAAQVEVGEVSTQGATLMTYDIRLDVEAAAVSGWQRIKIIWPGALIRHILIEGDDNAFYDAMMREHRFAIYVFIGPGINRLRLRLRAEASGTRALAVTLRSIHIIEYLWKVGWRGFSHPVSYFKYFTDPIESVVASGYFPGPAALVARADAYLYWIDRREQQVAPAILAELPVKVSERPHVSILMPVCEPESVYLRAAIDSVRAQTCPDWQLCISDDASMRSDVREFIASASKEDGRIRLVLREQRGRISAATNDAFELCDAPLVTTLDHNDTLSPYAVELASACYSARPNTALLYSDDDKIDQRGRRYLPYFKPRFSPELLYSGNYINHLTVHRAENIRRAGGWRSEVDGAQNYDLLLRTLEFVDAGQIRHVPAVLYHWRAIADPAAVSTNYKSYAVEAGQKALLDHFRRRGIPAEVDVTPASLYRIRYSLPPVEPKVSIVIPTRDKAALLRACVNSILKSTYSNLEIVIVDNASTQIEAIALLREYQTVDRIRVLSWPGTFNYSAINNFAVESVMSEFVCLLNNDTEVITADWLSDMVGYALQPGVGCVGAKLLFENDSVQHAGVILGKGGVSGHAFVKMGRNDPGYFGRAALTANWSAVTGACLLVRRSIYLEVGGLDEDMLPVAFNDIDFCIKVRNAGYRNVMTPFAQLHHYESLSRGQDDTLEKVNRFERECRVMIERYNDLDRDPYYSPHLDLRDDFAIDTRLDRRMEGLR